MIPISFEPNRKRLKIAIKSASNFRAADDLKMLMGFNVEAFGAIADAVAIPVIAAGGLATIDDIVKIKARKGVPIAGAVLGRALYNGAINPEEALKVAA